MRPIFNKSFGEKEVCMSVNNSWDPLKIQKRAYKKEKEKKKKEKEKEKAKTQTLKRRAIKILLLPPGCKTQKVGESNLQRFSHW